MRRQPRLARRTPRVTAGPEPSPAFGTARPPSAPEPGGRRGRTVLLAVVAGTAIANNYAIQPALTDIAAELHVPLSVIGLVPTAALLGCMTGFVLLLPLADRVAPNRLLPAQLTALAAALTLAAAAPGAGVLLAAYLLVGATAGVAAQAGALAGRLAPHGRRARAVAGVAAGMSAGILLSRLVGGALADGLGWRTMLLVFAAAVLLCATAAAWLLPGERPPARGTYPAAVRALPRLLRQHPGLRRAVAAGGLWYLAFNLVWVALALALGRPPYSLDPTAIGLYSLAGLLGFVALPVTGRLADRHSPRTVITASLATAATGTALLATGLGDPLVTVVGLALFDAGAFAAQAANQSRVMALDPERGGSLSGVYLVLYFAVGAVGTTIAAPLLEAVGWTGTALTALAALAAAAGVVRTGDGQGRDAVRKSPPR
ncbi:MFS transporter [Streptomyces aquilus]|uniref:MFS transporter n=1 Tax=Streptomyces aquilus TaxID=2548456 RepID=A0A3Q9C2Y8_9ACTN|nr:MFS transporter [Streptomyces aquilus]AZP17975.1 MFS transporter [Streptomyces aquilus]